MQAGAQCPGHSVLLTINLSYMSSPKASRGSSRPSACIPLASQIRPVYAYASRIRAHSSECLPPQRDWSSTAGLSSIVSSKAAAPRTALDPGDSCHSPRLSSRASEVASDNPDSTDDTALARHGSSGEDNTVMSINQGKLADEFHVDREAVARWTRVSIKDHG